MRQHITEGIVLGRTDYGEADRIITVLTPDHGKLRLMAKGVRRVKSKLAGGIELFSISDITYAPGKGEIGTLISARLKTYYGDIISDINRTMLGYDLIRRLNRVTEDETEAEYFVLLRDAFVALDDATVNTDLIAIWFTAQLLALGGHTPNLRTDSTGAELQLGASYDFNLDHMACTPQPNGRLEANDIKLLRLLFGANKPSALGAIGDLTDRLERVRPLIRNVSQAQLGPAGALPA